MLRHILRCDMTSVNSLLASISQQPNGIRRGNLVQELVDQLADGGKNILHLCVTMCAPTSNKESDETSASSLGAALDPYSAFNRSEDVGYVLLSFINK